MQFDHYIALNWSQKVMAYARITNSLKEVEVMEQPSDLKGFRYYLERLKGTKVLTL